MKNLPLFLILWLGGACMVHAVPPAPVSSLAFHPAANYLAAGTYGEIQIWQPTQKAPLYRVTNLTERVTAVAWSPDGTVLAAACGKPGKAGEIHLFQFAEKPNATLKLLGKIDAHKDLIYTLHFDPKSQRLASAGYDRLIHLWDVAKRTAIATLKDHSDTVYSVRFHPNGNYLLSAAADRAVKIWDLSNNKRLYSLNDPTDWLYAAEWHPDGKSLVAAGVDKSIRAWQFSPNGSELRQSVFAHTQAVSHLAFAEGGKSLISISESGEIKAWDSGTLKEGVSFPKQPATIFSLAVHPGTSQVAVGDIAGNITVLDAKTGKSLQVLTTEQVAANLEDVMQPIRADLPAPVIASVSPTTIVRGVPTTLTVTGKHFTPETKFQLPDATIKQVGEHSDSKIRLQVLIPKGVSPGPRTLTASLGKVASNPFTVQVDRFPQLQDQSELITQPTTIVGMIAKSGAINRYSLQLPTEQDVTFHIRGFDGAKFTPTVVLFDAHGKQLRFSETGLLGYRLAAKQTYHVRVHDRNYRGGAGTDYRFDIGPIPFITAAFPPSIERGRTEKVELTGFSLPVQEVSVAVPATAAANASVPLPLKSWVETPLGQITVRAAEFPLVAWQGKTTALQMNSSGQGVLQEPGTHHDYRFAAKKGQTVALEVHASRIGSPLDSLMEVLDSHGKVVERATLRCTARSFVTFRDHDSNKPGIRLEYWNELRQDDYLLVGNELMRILALPLNPDADCNFYQVGGKRQAFLGTSPTHHPNGEAVYRVEIHPAGSQFPPNGMPLVRLPYRNDDGGDRFGTDSVLFFTPPADGEYQVRVQDSQSNGSEQHFYRLTLREPKPDFNVTSNGGQMNVWQHGAVPLDINMQRFDEFDGEVRLEFTGVPEGYFIPTTTIEAGQLSTTVMVENRNGKVTMKPANNLQIVATAMINGKPVRKSINGPKLQTVVPGDIVLQLSTTNLEVVPGKQTRLKVTVERRNKFKGRIPIQVKGLPHGVRVLDIGLNGILITERESEREIVLEAERWVAPQTGPISIFATREGKNTSHGNRNIQLRVMPTLK
ncbi:MAG: WD40 repeat domain-containing protein [Zavarzinella sp.]